MLGFTIGFAKMAVVVPDKATCALACFIAFAAAEKKFANYSARIGVHGFSDLNGNESTHTRSVLVGAAKLLKQFGVPADIIGQMVVTPPDQMVWLTPDNLRAMGTTMTGRQGPRQ